MSLQKTYRTFDDVLIKPAYSEIDSRSTIDTSSKFLNWDLDVPIISANMSSVTGPRMAEAMHINGAMGILHRDATLLGQATWGMMLKEHDIPVHYSTGLAEKHVYNWDTYADSITIDTAHGDRGEVVTLIRYLRQLYPRLKIIAGNVATADGFMRLAKAGADAIKVGIGPGAACTTREMTGVGVPQLTAIEDCVEVKYENWLNVAIIADGGVKNPGDMAKALAAGADAVMIGRQLARTEEAEGPVIAEWPGSKFKYREYAGQSTMGSNASRKAVEGISGLVPIDTTVQDFIASWKAYLQTSMSYVGARNLDEFRVRAEFIPVSPGTATESGTRLARSWD